MCLIKAEHCESFDLAVVFSKYLSTVWECILGSIQFWSKKKCLFPLVFISSSCCRQTGILQRAEPWNFLQLSLRGKAGFFILIWQSFSCAKNAFHFCKSHHTEKSRLTYQGKREGEGVFHCSMLA